MTGILVTRKRKRKGKYIIKGIKEHDTRNRSSEQSLSLKGTPFHSIKPKCRCNCGSVRNIYSCILEYDLVNKQSWIRLLKVSSVRVLELQELNQLLSAGGFSKNVETFFDLGIVNMDLKRQQWLTSANEEVIKLCEASLVTFCIANGVGYWQGLHDVVAGLTFLEPRPTVGELVAILETLLKRFAPALFQGNAEEQSTKFQRLYNFFLVGSGMQLRRMGHEGFWTLAWFSVLGFYRFACVYNCLAHYLVLVAAGADLEGCMLYELGMLYATRHLAHQHMSLCNVFADALSDAEVTFEIANQNLEVNAESLINISKNPWDVVAPSSSSSSSSSSSLSPQSQIQEQQQEIYQVYHYPLVAACKFAKVLHSLTPSTIFSGHGTVPLVAIEDLFKIGATKVDVTTSTSNSIAGSRRNSNDSIHGFSSVTRRPSSSVAGEDAQHPASTNRPCHLWKRRIYKRKRRRPGGSNKTFETWEEISQKILEQIRENISSQHLVRASRPKNDYRIKFARLAFRNVHHYLIDMRSSLMKQAEPLTTFFGRVGVSIVNVADLKAYSGDGPFSFWIVISDRGIQQDVNNPTLVTPTEVVDLVQVLQGRNFAGVAVLEGGYQRLLEAAKLPIPQPTQATTGAAAFVRNLLDWVPGFVGAKKPSEDTAVPALDLRQVSFDRGLESPLDVAPLSSSRCVQGLAAAVVAPQVVFEVKELGCIVTFGSSGLVQHVFKTDADVQTLAESLQTSCSIGPSDPLQEEIETINGVDEYILKNARTSSLDALQVVQLVATFTCLVYIEGFWEVLVQVPRIGTSRRTSTADPPALILDWIPMQVPFEATQCRIKLVNDKPWTCYYNYCLVSKYALVDALLWTQVPVLRVVCLPQPPLHKQKSKDSQESDQSKSKPGALAVTTATLTTATSTTTTTTTTTTRANIPVALPHVAVLQRAPSITKIPSVGSTRLVPRKIVPVHAPVFVPRAKLKKHNLRP